MKKFLLMLLIAGAPGFASMRGLGFLDFDVGISSLLKSYLTIRSVQINPATKEVYPLHRVHYDTKGTTEDDQKRESQNAIQEARICPSFIHLFTIEKAEDKSAHQVHTHDVPDWNLLQNCFRCWCVKFCRLIHHQIPAHAGMAKLYFVPIFAEGTAA